MSSKRKLGPSHPSWRIASRRRFLAATASVTVAGLAGCSDVTTQAFEAPPVVLPAGAREEMVLAETARDSQTIEHEVEEIDGEISLTNQFAAYARGPARAPFSTLLERFLSRVNGTEGPGPAVVVSGSDINFDEGALDIASEMNSPDHVSLVVPAGVRSDSETKPEVGAPISGPFMLGWMTDGSIPVDMTGTTENPRTYIVKADEFFPGEAGTFEQAPFSTGEAGTFEQAPFSKRWLPQGEIPPDLWSPDTNVLIMLGDTSPEDVFGVPVADMPGERVTEGTSRATGNNPFLLTAPATIADNADPENFYSTVFDAGLPAPTGGASYGMGVLSTPNAVVADQSVNPLMQLSLEELLTNDTSRQLLNRAGITDADGFEWLKGPKEIGDVPDGTEFADVPDGTEFSDNPDGTTVNIINETAETKIYAGVVAGDYPWLVVVNLARTEYDDFAVITAGTQRMPVAATNKPVGSGAFTDVPDGTEFARSSGSNNPFLPWIGNGALVSTLAWGELEAQ